MTTGYNFTPAYIKIKPKDLQNRIDKALSLLSSCTVCPRECKVNREKGEKGFCQTSRFAYVASFDLHFGEEDPLVGSGGSGTIFFAGCNLGCVFCQNYDISHTTYGSVEVTPLQLASMMLELQERGAHNINFVTPTHVVPQILEALPLAIEGGLKVPLVYNTSAYDKVETLKLLEGVIDIYMPDTKFIDPKYAKKYCLAEDYPEVAKKAIKEMHRQVGDLVMDENGIALRGLLVRHLLMPDDIAGTEKWLKFLAEEISLNTYLNIMDQYRPCGEANRFPELQSFISYKEYEEAIKLAQKMGFKRLDKRDSRFFRRILKLIE